MANLSSKMVVKFVPSLPGNKELPEPLSFSVVAGLSLMEVRAWKERIAALKFAGAEESEIVERINTAFEGVATLNGSHTIDSKPINTVGDYMSIVGLQPGAPLMNELMKAVLYNNSAEGLTEVFCGRSSGGTPSTAEAVK